MTEDLVVVVVPLGEALVRAIITSTCAEADALRSTLTAPALVCCRCRLARLLLTEAEPAEARLVERFALALNDAGIQ